MARQLSDDELDQPLPGLTEQAFQWLVDLHSGNADAAQWDEHQRWCETSAEHQHAALAAERLWRGLGSALERPPARRRHPPLLGLVIALGLCAGLFWQAQQYGWTADQRTATGERRSLQLADGSHLELAPHSRVDIDVSGARRVVRLYAGELFVQVAPDAQRPFEVEAGDATLQALGTAFDVRRDGATVRLVVTEHTVKATSHRHDATEQTLVKAGEGVTIDPAGISPIHRLDTRQATAWRRDRLVFDGQPLGQVLDELARYQSGLVWIRDAQLREQPVTGIFDTRDLDTQLRLLERSLPIKLVHLPWLTLVEYDESRR